MTRRAIDIRFFPHRLVRAAAVCLIMVLSVGCGEDKPASAVAVPDVPKAAAEESEGEGLSDRPPPPPFTVPAAAIEPGTDVEGRDVSEIPPSQLSAHARRFAQEYRWQDALKCQYHATKKTGRGQYDLSCYYARCGEPQAAIHWLLQAAQKEGVDATWARKDFDLDAVRNDPRWDVIDRYLEQCEKHWSQSGARRVVTILPDGYANDRPLPTLVWLHGLGGTPSELSFEDYYQKLANDMQVAVVALSGSRVLGPDRFGWWYQAARNTKHVMELLKSTEDKLQIAPGKIVPFGFSQGGQVAMDLAAHDPERFAGAIVLSPGGVPFELESFVPGDTIRRSGFVCLCGEKEHPGNVYQTKWCADWGREHGARVQHRVFPGQTMHSFPPDYQEMFPEWVRFVLER